MELFQIIKFAKPDIGGVAVIVKWLVGITSSIAVGIILFTLVLKLITFPFDFYSRYSMRKNSVKMEEMRPDLEKLQKQYANDKVLYNQKMMALYKKNGYSMWGACLPTILTLVIFIVAISGFSSYSRFQNREYFYNMSLSYNTAIYDGVIEDTSDKKYIIKNETTGEIEINPEIIKTGEYLAKDKNGKDYKITTTTEGNFFVITTEGGYTTIKVDYNDANKKFNNILYYVTSKEAVSSYYKYTFSEEATTTDAVNYIKGIARERSAEKYREEQVNFLWVKNIWVTDSPIAHPVCASWDNDKGGCGCSGCFGSDSGFEKTHDYSNDEDGDDIAEGNMNATLYNELIYDLQDKIEEANGYFILCIITAGITFLMQFVTSKSQKAQMELQTVDGQGARQQKMMMWMMPIMMAFFSFMYTAAFSIYLILSSTISILTTFLINWVVDKKLGKVKVEQKQEIIRGRVYNKPYEEKKKDNKKEEKEKVKGDFIPQQPDEKKKKKFFKK